MENCVERESYALTAGLALGLVTLGRGETAPGLADLRLPVSCSNFRCCSFDFFLLATCHKSD